MKRRKLYLIWAVCLGTTSGAYAQRYKLGSVRAARYEITAEWDARPDSSVMRLIDPYLLSVDSLMSPVLGESEVEMRADRPESLLSNYVADVLREASRRIGPEADMGLCNVGGLRSAMPQGKVTYGDVLEIAPFENRLCVVSLTGEKLRELMEQIAAVGGEGISGASLVITAEGKAGHILVGGKPIDPKRVYTIATLDYLAEGNDRMYALKEHVKRQDTDIAVRELIMDAIRQTCAQGKKVTSRMEGRITKEQ